jgi:hypothetical protein
MKKVYTKCYLCRQEKEPTASGYCNPCGKEYSRQRRLRLKDKKYSYDDIEMFRNKVISNYYLIDLRELNEIISIYSEIVFNVNEYDNFPAGIQLMKMWDKILNYEPKVKESKPKVIKIKEPKEKRKANYSEKQREWILANKERINQKRRERYLLLGK